MGENKQTLNYAFRSGLAGGIAGCVARTSLCWYSAVLNIHFIQGKDSRRTA